MTHPIPPASLSDTLDFLAFTMREMQRSGSWDADTMARVVETTDAFVRDMKPAFCIPPASGDLEAVARIVSRARGIQNGPKPGDFRAATMILDELAALPPANPPATAAGVGEAVAWRIRDGQSDGDWKYYDGSPHMPSALIQSLYTSPASHDALIATGCFECDTPLIGPLCPKCNPAHETPSIIRAILSASEARDD